MRRFENKSFILVFGFWITLVILLFLHTSGKINIPWFHFPQEKGILLLVKENYKGYNIVGLREELYCLGGGVPFTHPKRIDKLKEYKIFVSHSIEEAQRMIDAKSDQIPNKLTLSESNFQGYNIYISGGNFLAVQAMNPWGAPDTSKSPYKEFLVGHSLDEAKSYIQNHPEMGTEVH